MAAVAAMVRPATTAFIIGPPGIRRVSAAPAKVAASDNESKLELKAPMPFLPSYMAAAAATPAPANAPIALPAMPPAAVRFLNPVAA